MTLELKFKSVGKTNVTVATERQLNKNVNQPLGIKTPLRRGGASEGVYAMNSDLLTQISDNLRNLILTNHGERLGLYDFGGNLQPLMSELTSNPELEIEAMSRIRISVSKYMPHVSLETFQSSIDHSQNQHVGKVILKVGYGVPTLNVTGKIIEVVFYLM